MSLWASKQTLTINRKKNLSVIIARNPNTSVKLEKHYLLPWNVLHILSKNSKSGRTFPAFSQAFLRQKALWFFRVFWFFLQEMHYGYYIVKYLPSISIDFSNIELHQWLSFSMLIYWLCFCLSMGLNSLKLG